MNVTLQIPEERAALYQEQAASPRSHGGAVVTRAGRSEYASPFYLSPSKDGSQKNGHASSALGRIVMTPIRPSSPTRR